MFQLCKLTSKGKCKLPEKDEPDIFHVTSVRFRSENDKVAELPNWKEVKKSGAKKIGTLLGEADIEDIAERVDAHGVFKQLREALLKAVNEDEGKRSKRWLPS